MKIILVIIILVISSCGYDSLVESNLSDRSEYEVITTSVFISNSLVPQTKLWGEVISDGEKGYIFGPNDISQRDSGFIGEKVDTKEEANSYSTNSDTINDDTLKESDIDKIQKEDFFANNESVSSLVSNDSDSQALSTNSSNFTDGGNISNNLEENKGVDQGSTTLADDGSVSSVISNNDSDSQALSTNSSNFTDGGNISNNLKENKGVDQGSTTLADNGGVSSNNNGNWSENLGDKNELSYEKKALVNGNNGVGNGLDPQPSGNSPLNDGELTTPGSPGMAGPKKCKKCSKSIELKFVKICSEMRSKIPYPKFVFFEEMKNPIVSFEINWVEKKYLAMPFSKCLKCERELNHELLGYKRLSPIQLFDGGNKDIIYFDKKLTRQKIRKAYYVEVLVCDDTNNNGYCSDEKDEFIVSLSKPKFSLFKIPRTLVLNVWHGRNLSMRTEKKMCEKQYSPLVMDLAGDGILLTGPESLIKFDLNDSGEKIYTGWPIGKDDAFLVYDINKNGKIDSGAELFGSATLLSNFERAPNGFYALAQYDDNKDELITREDNIWRKLRLWVDKNFNGISERKEIYKLEELGIEFINLNYVDLDEVDEFGNATRMRTTFGRNGRIGVIIDVWFNTFLTE